MYRLATVLMMLVTAPTALAYTAAELAAKNVDAKGGVDKLSVIQSLRLSGKLMANGGKLQFGFSTLVRRPHSIRYEARDGIARVTIDRPAQRNALGPSEWRGLGAALERAVVDDVGAMILSGAGECFCSGGDIKTMPERLALPPFLEPRRVEIEAGLRPIGSAGSRQGV